MDIYRRKRFWKWGLFIIGLMIVNASLMFSNNLVKKIASDERKKVKIWANAIQQKANLVNYTNDFFKKVKEEERKRVEIWAEATKRLINAGINEDLSFYTQIIAGNTTIPVVLTDENKNIIAVKNVDFSTDSVKVLEGRRLSDFSKIEPIVVSYGEFVNYLYFKESLLFSELRNVLNDLTESFFSEVVVNSASVPVLILDSAKTKVFSSGNVSDDILNDKDRLHDLIKTMEAQNPPIVIDFEGQGKKYIYYKDSYLLTQLRYYPFVQLIVVGLFLIVAYIIFNTTRKAEQNKVWVGMAKETAHQLGTPISSMLAWLDFIETDDKNKIYIDELRNDIKRLQDVSSRFSNIGSAPDLPMTSLAETIYNSVRYIRARSSKKVAINVLFRENETIEIPLNENLFGWVMENLLKNAIDAMEGEGSITISLHRVARSIMLDVSDTGKGFPKSQYKAVFRPGFTTKKRGWGLGLTLSKRIIDEYHKGRLYVYSSVPGKGTTFRIVLPLK
ncbi:Adaptive-response sensory-kinase SasA [bioreactor metagenome]|uniref:Adaptive-response sensory-kinase SasA n=1 Tax=bioreactor metagenome TaxID=1076179 RepID=A0A644WNZ2_9ZZZZ